MNTDKPHIAPKEHHNYVAFFLTFACNLRCHYCINLHNSGLKNRHSGEHMNWEKWVEAANRLFLRPDLPLTLQGGEPTLYKGFFRLVNEVKEEIKMDLLTNMMFDVDKFIKNVPVSRFSRVAPYAPIRVSYHPGQNNIDDLIKKALKMQDAGFRVGLFSVLQPDEEIKKHLLGIKEKCLNQGIDFRYKEFLGMYQGKLYGTFKYEGVVCGEKLKYCKCRSTEIIADPLGYVYKCHADLYLGRNPIAHILDEDFTQEKIDEFRDCSYYGSCNPCDVKVKTDRFQKFGHTSVEIKDIKALKTVS